MGIDDSKVGEYLFDKTRRGILTLLYNRLGEAFYVNQIVSSCRRPFSGAVQRELRMMTEAGIAVREKRGNMVLCACANERLRRCLTNCRVSLPKYRHHPPPHPRISPPIVSKSRKNYWPIFAGDIISINYRFTGQYCDKILLRKVRSMSSPSSSPGMPPDSVL